MSPLRDAGSLFRGDSLSSGSGSWSVSSSELGGDDGSSPASGRRHRRSSSGAMSSDRCHLVEEICQTLPAQQCFLDDLLGGEARFI